MSEIETASSYRSEIALRTRRRALDGRVRKLTGAVFGLMGFSAFSNFYGVLGSLSSFLTSPPSGLLSIAVGLLLGALYSLGAYRVWFKDDTRWWPVAIPACISIVLSVLAIAAGKPAVLLVLLLNVALLVIVPIRRRAAAAAEAIAVKPLSGSPSFKE